MPKIKVYFKILHNLEYANNQEVFRIKYSIEEEETGQEGRKIQFFVVRQTHVPTKIEKILKAPLIIDQKKYIDAALSKPPYPKEKVGGKERLHVPWKDLGRIVGAALSYSYPSQAPNVFNLL